MQLIVLVVMFLLLVRFTDRLYDRVWDRQLSADLRFLDRSVTEGGHVLLEETVENRKLLPLPTLTVYFRMDRSLLFVEKQNTALTDYQYRADIPIVMGRQRIVRRYRVHAVKRGFYVIDKISLSSCTPFFSHRTNGDGEVYTSLYVYPGRSKIPGLDEIFRHLYGEYLVRRFSQEDPFAFRGIRDYAPSDPMRHINWKATARSAALKVNQYYPTCSADAAIFLNTDRRGVNYSDEVLEESVRIARTFLESFISAGVPVRIISNGRDLVDGSEIRMAPGSGSGHPDSCLQKFARMDLSREVRPMEELVEGEARASAPERPPGLSPHHSVPDPAPSRCLPELHRQFRRRVCAGPA
jgi:uncharacterized protein (DUF58 family)